MCNFLSFVWPSQIKVSSVLINRACDFRALNKWWGSLEKLHLADAGASGAASSWAWGAAQRPGLGQGSVGLPNLSASAGWETDGPKTTEASAALEATAGKEASFSPWS